MSQKESNEFGQNNSDYIQKFQNIVLQINFSTSTNPSTLETLTEELFSECFQSLFPNYNKTCPKCCVSKLQASPIPPTDEDLWIFGYGSLVWKADFPYIDRKQGYIEGYQRRFFQHSIDHRGTPEKPGRVVTLIPSSDPEAKVYGVAYRIAKEQKNEVLAHLDYREKNGYERNTLNFTEFDSGNSIDVVMYIATNQNDSFAGGSEDNLEPIAEQIYETTGPSGQNREYLYFLADAMRELFPGVVDEHLFKLEELVKQYERRDQILVDVIKSKICNIFNSSNADEAVDKFKCLLDDCSQKSYLTELYNNIKCDR